MGLNYWKLEDLKSALGLNYWKLEDLKSALGLNYWKLEDLKSALGLNYWKLEDLKSAMGPYCRQFKSSVCFFFFPTLPICMSKIYLVMPIHILMLPRHTSGPVMLCIPHYKCKMCTTWVQIVSGHHPIFFRETEGLGQGQTRKIKKQAVLFR